MMEKRMTRCEVETWVARYNDARIDELDPEMTFEEMCGIEHVITDYSRCDVCDKRLTCKKKGWLF